MPALSFQKRFAKKVEAGTKRQTVRDRGVRDFKVGDRLFLFEGMRTKACRRLFELFYYKFPDTPKIINPNPDLFFVKYELRKKRSGGVFMGYHYYQVIIPYVECLSVQDIVITQEGIIYSDADRYARGTEGSVAFAIADGFDTEDEFYEFFKVEKERVLIKW